jgi:hypothetical protein
MPSKTAQPQWGNLRRIAAIMRNTRPCQDIGFWFGQNSARSEHLERYGVGGPIDLINGKNI